MNRAGLKRHAEIVPPASKYKPGACRRLEKLSDYFRFLCRKKSLPPADGDRRSRRDPGLARGAEGHPQSHTLRYDRMMILLDPTPIARGLAGKKVQLPGRALRCPAERYRAAVPGVRQDPDGGAQHDRREQADRRSAGVRAGAASVVSTGRRWGDPRRQRPPNNLEAPGMPTKGRPSRKVLAAAAE